MRNYTHDNIEEIAYSLLPNGEFTEPPIDIESIIISQGIKIREDSSLDSAIIGKITFDNDEAIISINPNENTYKSRRRFTLAHEFGHYVLHSKDSKREFIDLSSTMFRTESSNDFEQEANHFAASILMPESKLIEKAFHLVEYYKVNKSEFSEDEFIRRLALDFNVSMQSMRYRLKNLDILE